MSTPVEPTTVTLEAPAEPETPEEPTGVVPVEVEPVEPQAGTTTDPWADPDAARREIERLRRENAASRTKAKDRDELARRIAEFERAKLTDQERLTVELADAQKRAQALQARTVRAEVRAAATGFADPEDAAAFLVLDSYVDAQGDIDAAQIAADLADLLERKPHLAKSVAPVTPPAEPVPPRRPAPDRTQAAGANPTHASTAGDTFGEWWQNAAFGR